MPAKAAIHSVVCMVTKEGLLTIAAKDFGKWWKVKTVCLMCTPGMLG